MRENIENLLAVAWWVILNSPDLFFVVLNKIALIQMMGGLKSHEVSKEAIWLDLKVFVRKISNLIRRYPAQKKF